MTEDESAPILSVEGLTIAPLAANGAPIVQDLAFHIARGEALGIVGESGSGKSMTALALAGLLPEGVAVSAGRICLQGRDLAPLRATERRALAGSRIGMVFQDPLSSFNPVRRVGSLLVESVERHRGFPRAAARAAALDAFAAVRLAPALAEAYPHQLSGGQRQRAMLALALVNDPELLIADEPTTALDATVQLQVLALVKRNAGSRALLLITHDLAVAAAVCDRILVMQGGRCVEQGTVERVLGNPRERYTRELLAAARTLSGRMAEPAEVS